MKVTYDLTADDLAAFEAFHHRHSPTVNRQLGWTMLLGILVLLILPGFILVTTEEPKRQVATDILPLLLGPPIFVVLFLFNYKRRVRKLARSMRTEGRNAGFFGECSLLANEEGLCECKASGETKRKWSAVEKIAATERYLFIYTSGTEAFVVPRRAFATGAAFDAFVQFLADHADAVV